MVESEKNKTLTIGITVASIILVISAVGIAYYLAERDPVVNVFDDSFQVTGMFGATVYFEDVVSISLLEDNINSIGVGNRVNGYAGFGDTLRGEFVSRSHGRVLLFVRSGVSPVIHVERDVGNDVFINFREREMTEALFQELVDAFRLFQID